MARMKGKKRKNNRAVGYVRRSTNRQEQSIGDQKKALQEYIDRYGFKLVKFYIDDAISGTSTLGRKAFQQMIQDAESSPCPFDIIVVYDIKRFGRIDNDEAGYYRYLLRTHGVEVHYVSENFNGDSTDDLLRPVKQWQARQESKDLSKVTIRGLLSRINGGWWMGGVPPYGYDLRYVDTKGEFLLKLRYMADGSKQILDEKGRLIRTLGRKESLNISKSDRAKLTPSEPERVKVIKRIFKMYTEQGKGYNAIADTLNQEDIPPPRGPEWSHIYCGKWTHSTIRAILVNPVYSGDMVWNRRTDGRFHRISEGRAVNRESIHGARLVPNGKEDWIFVRDAHPPLLSRRMFEQTKQRFENHPKAIEQRRNNHGKHWNGQRSRFILSGLMKCYLCDSRYQGITIIKGKRRLDGTRIKTRYYGCGGYITKGSKFCQPNRVPQKVLESAVINKVLDFYRPYLDKDGHRKLAQAVRTQIGEEENEFANALKRTQAKLKKVEKAIYNLLDNVIPNNRGYEDQRLKELKQKKHLLKARLEEIERLSLSQTEIETIVTDAMEFLSGLEFTLRQGLPLTKLVALRQCIKVIWINEPIDII